MAAEVTLRGSGRSKAFPDGRLVELGFGVTCCARKDVDQCGGLETMRCLDRHVLIALGGTEFHCSDKIHCPNCSHRKRGKDKTEYFHTMLAAAIIAPA